MFINLSQIILAIFTIFLTVLSNGYQNQVTADVIMMDGNSMPSIVEDDSDRPDVFVGGTPGQFIINDDIIL